MSVLLLGFRLARGAGQIGGMLPSVFVSCRVTAAAATAAAAIGCCDSGRLPPEAAVAFLDDLVAAGELQQGSRACHRVVLLVEPANHPECCSNTAITPKARTA